MSYGLILSAANPGLLAFGVGSSSTTSYGESDYHRRMRLQRRRDEEDQRRAFSYEEGDYDDVAPVVGRYQAPHVRRYKTRGSTETARRVAADRAMQTQIDALPVYEWRRPVSSKEWERTNDLYERYGRAAQKIDEKLEQQRLENIELEAKIIEKMARNDKRDDMIIFGILISIVAVVGLGAMFGMLVALG